MTNRKEMIRTKATVQDREKVITFYDDIIEQQQYDDYSPLWTRGIYPSDDDIDAFIRDNCLLLVKDGDRITAAAVLIDHEEEMYLDVSWKGKFKEDQISVVHLLGVHPDYRRQGYSDELIDYLLKTASEKSKAIHLDVVEGNLPAERLYLKHGFTYAGRKDVFYEDTGEITVRLYEYIF